MKITIFPLLEIGVETMSSEVSSASSCPAKDGDGSPAFFTNGLASGMLRVKETNNGPSVVCIDARSMLDTGDKGYGYVCCEGVAGVAASNVVAGEAVKPR